MSADVAAAWATHPLAKTIDELESRLTQTHPKAGIPPMTAEEMSYALAGHQLDQAPAGVCVLPDFTPVRPPKPAATLVATVGDFGMVGSTLKSSSDFLHPAKAPPAPVSEVIFWARKWEMRQWIARDPAEFEGKRVWLKLWGVPGVLLNP